jgi:hypothetical protein
LSSFSFSQHFTLYYKCYALACIIILALLAPVFKTKNIFLTLYAFFLLLAKVNGQPAAADTTPVSTQQQAISFIGNVKSLEQSPWWPAIKPNLFLENIKRNIYKPLELYEGSNTNFCGYAALSYLPLHDDPLGYAKNMLQLYREGSVKWGKALLEPSAQVRQQAGRLSFKGTLDVNPADQVWFMTLADHFKSYVNFFNKKYDPGDENTFWASVTYGKFNRMVRELFNYKVHARGSDLLHPWIKDLYSYIKDQMQTGTTALFLNNAYLYKKQHTVLKPGTPTHYVIILDMYKTDDLITIIYWDYGFRSLRQVTPRFLKKIIFGITHCTKKLSNEK